MNEQLARQLCDNPDALLVWLADRSMSLADIVVVHPASGRRASADEMLLLTALHSERVGPLSTAWVLEQIQQWLMAHGS